jgi:hypothetical protein
MTSGSQLGTVTAKMPPGFNTRYISAIAATSSWMCSSTSEVITTSKLSSGKGRQVASPRSAPPNRSAGISPASTIAATVERVETTSASP